MNWRLIEEERGKRERRSSKRNGSTESTSYIVVHSLASCFPLPLLHTY